MTETYNTDFNPYLARVSQIPAFSGASMKFREDLSSIRFGTPDQIIANELLLLQARSEDAIRNNGYAKAARDTYVINLGAPKVIWKDVKGRKHARMQAMWDEFTDNPSLDGLGTLDNIISIWNSSIFATGNAFTRMHIRRTGNVNKVPLKLELVQSNLHDIFYFGGDIANNRDTRNGIRFNDGKPVEYFFRLDLYREFPLKQFSQAAIGIPATDIIHIFHREYPNQWLGIPSLSSILIPLYELDELLDATVARQKAAQAISYIITNSNPLSTVPVGTPLVDKTPKGDKVSFKAKGTNVQYLNRGESITFHQGADIGNNFTKLAELELRRISNAVHIPYHQLTGDTSGINFSTLRALLIELRGRLEYIQHFQIIPLGLAPLAMRFKELASLYAPGVKNAIPTYQLPRFFGTDDLKDAQADLLEVQNGMSTLERKLEERHTTFEEIASDRERIKELGLTHLLDPTGGVPNHTTAAGNNLNPNSTSTSN